MCLFIQIWRPYFPPTLGSGPGNSSSHPLPGNPDAAPPDRRETQCTVFVWRIYRFAWEPKSVNASLGSLGQCFSHMSFYRSLSGMFSKITGSQAPSLGNSDFVAF